MFDTRPEGFEPPTSWSVARHSIQLSYGRKQQCSLPTIDGHDRPSYHFIRKAMLGKAPPNKLSQHHSAKSAHDRTRTCTPFPTLVPQTSLSTNSSTWAIRPIMHPHTNRCSERDSNPHEVNPHRVLNPARLPIPPPEQIRAWGTGVRAPQWSRGESNP